MAICPLTNYATVHPFQKLKVDSATRFFLENVIVVHSAMEEIVTDKGTRFTSKIFSKAAKLFNISYNICTSSHHLSSGTAERAIKS